MPGREPKHKGNPRTTSGRGVYPGSFNPPTVGHLQIIEAAMASFDLRSVDLALSRSAINKENVERPTLAHRVEVLKASVSHIEGVRVTVTDLRLIADIAAGYDVVVMGADKWAQVNDERFYESSSARDSALERLPTLAIAPRGTHHVPHQARLAVAPELDSVSSSKARAGDLSMMTVAALAFDDRSGAWTNPDRYERFIENHPAG